MQRKLCLFYIEGYAGMYTSVPRGGPRNIFFWEQRNFQLNVKIKENKYIKCCIVFVNRVSLRCQKERSADGRTERHCGKSRLVSTP